MRHKAYISKAAILRIIAIVTKHKNSTLGHNGLAIAGNILALGIILVNILFLQLFSVDENLTILHLDGVTTNCDNTFDEIPALILGETENHDFATLGISEKIAQLIHNQAFMML